jgi:hypothetical protein
MPELDELKAKIEKLQRAVLILYLLGAKATQVALDAELDPKMSEEELNDLLGKIESGELTIHIPEEMP